MYTVGTYVLCMWVGTLVYLVIVDNLIIGYAVHPLTQTNLIRPLWDFIISILCYQPTGIHIFIDIQSNLKMDAPPTC